MPDRAVSEAVSFVLIFALITSSVGIVYATGFGTLTHARDAERFTNAERAFDVLADNMADLQRDGAPSRATEIKLAGATLRAGQRTNVSVEITNLGVTPHPRHSIDLTPIVYDAGTGSTLVYESGMVIRTDNPGAIAKNKPNVVFREASDGERTALLPLMQVRMNGDDQITGSSTVLVRGERSVSEILTERTSPGADGASEIDGQPRYAITVSIHTTTDRAPVWMRFLNEQIPSTWHDGDGDVCSLSADDDSTVECSFAVDRLFVTATRVDVGIA